ncbi:DUF7824 domain-containing protein [Microbispora bryophytorum]|uniref:DUF7824 domain-containing protein n=1 Tax=Microbispora bryophytorum TaxID=1460882 RepID=A0A8H9H055_9ACTN|nr:DUF6493 family protein [Microbispora bryophytorum]MBD3140104.1 hypothetical protein [Microbispora bryophytorum]TQS04864.1 hypothetical protein FLX07_19370 [Microbispora bryophytorum]GGO16475.1 hypothetical protein GCM10011574_39100 [Microbispora bryophytorum]
MTVWTEIRDLISGNHVSRLADRLVTLTEEERAELGGRLPGLVKELRHARTEQVRAQHPGDFEELASWEVGDLLDKLAGALLLTGVGVITGPAAAVTWMTGRDVNRRWAEDPNIAQVCRVAATRPLEWRRDVAVRLAQRVRRPTDRIAPLAVALLRESGAVPPDHDPLVAAWLAAPSVADDPLTPVLLPRVFTADGAGRALRDERLEPRPTRWLATAARELPREQVLDGCVRRFLRGGEAQDLRFFVRLHTLVDPTPAESAPRLRDYLRLLPSAPGTVAELAAGQVRGAMPLDHADLAEAVDALTFRDESKLAATGLRWLDQAIRATPEAAADFVTALTTAYAHKSFDVRGRAVELTLKYAGLFADHAEAILDGARHLPADLAAKLAGQFGGEVGGDTPVEEPLEQKDFPPLPEPAETRRFPEPSIFPDYQERWVGQERWLAAFVAGIADDREGLRRTLKPHVEQNQGYWRSRQVRIDPGDWQSALSAEFVNPGSVPELPPIGPEKFWDSANHSVRMRLLTRGEEPEPEPSPRRITVGGVYRPGRYLDDDTPLRAFFITWTSDDGPDGAVAREGDRQIPFAGGRIHLNGSPTDVEEAWHDGAEEEDEEIWDDELPDRPHPMRTRPGALYDDSVEAMPSFILDRAYEHMAELGVNPARIAAMRRGEPVPPPQSGEPLVEVTVVFVPPRLRSFMPKELPEHDEWRRRNQLPHPNRVSPPHDFLLHRYAELAEALRNGTLPPVLLATPTWMSGRLDPDVLIDRLETCAAAGVEPPPADLAQALLRLPRGCHQAAADRAAKVGSEAARSAARWLAGDGMADPECGHVWRHMVNASMVDFGDGEPEHFTEVRLRPVLRMTAPTGHRLIDEVLLREPFDWTIDESDGTLRAWPGMLPSHREVAAVNFLPFLLRGHWGGRVTPADVAGLEIAEGPMGESTAVILAFLLAGGVPDMIPLVLRMAVRGELPAEAIGHQLALVLRRTWRETRPAIAALTELADAGGHHEVWRILRTLLPGMLPGEGQRATVTHSELVAFAADVARWTGARGEIPVIGEFARSRRTTRFVHECRRLHAQLTGATS